jgi:hypothetical protein
MSKYVRVIAHEANASKEATPALYFDLIINSDSEIEDNGPIFGFHGDLGNRSGRSMPFVLYPYDRADFGEYAPEDDRHETITLRDGKITKGQTFTYRGTGFYREFEIIEIKSLLDADERS